MNGASKYKQHLLFRYQREIILVFCSILIFFGIGNAFISSRIDTKAIKTADYYNIIYDGRSMGIVKDKFIADELYRIAKNEIIDENGEHVKVNKDIQYYLDYAKEEDITDRETLLNNLRIALAQDKDSFQVKGYVLRIGEDFQVALKNEDDVKEVLRNAQSKYVVQIEGYNIDLVNDPNEESIKRPVIVKNEDYQETLRTVANIDEDNVSTENNECKEAEIPLETVDVSFTEDIQIVKEYVDKEVIKEVDIATTLITKENEEETIYSVVQGDSLSLIASKNNMQLEELIKLNPGIDKKKFIKIGEELIVTVPEPELSVSCDEKVMYTKPIQYTVTKVENKEKYKGTTTILENGVDGEMQVTALVTKVNGQEQSRSVIGEKVIKEPKAQVIEIGIKPFPSKGSTGNFIYPVVGGIMTSPFGYRHGKFHHGLDLGGLSTGTTIRASDGGTVTFAGWKNSIYGNTVDIDHGNGVLTRYAHCNEVVVKKGQTVSQYQEIAKLGNTGYSSGPHIHFEIRFDNVAANPIKYLQ